jgi:hypothetical protein
LIFGGHDAVLADTFLTIEQNQRLIEWVKGARARTDAHLPHVRATATTFTRQSCASKTLTDEQWHLQSGPQGWSVKDVVAHAGCLMALLVAAVRGEQTPGNIGIEELNEVQVAQKRGLDGAETMAFVRSDRAG